MNHHETETDIITPVITVPETVQNVPEAVVTVWNGLEGEGIARKGPKAVLNVLKAEEIVLKSQKRKMKRIVPHLVRIR